MGATTLYHPVSPIVIRGAAIYHGFQFGRLVQTHVYREKTWAQYRVAILSMPKYLKDASTPTVQKALQQCFLDDIRVHWLRQGKSGTWYVDLVVDLRMSTDAPEDDLAWLTAKENSSGS